MMKRDACFAALARHISDEIVVATYSSAVEWNELNPRVLNYFSMGAMGLARTRRALGRGSREADQDSLEVIATASELRADRVALENLA